MKVIDVMDMVDEYLKTNGYDGLLQEDGECACLLGDLAPCGEIMGSCRAGHRVECDENVPEGDRPANCDGKCAFHVVIGKRPGGEDTDTDGRVPVIRSTDSSNVLIQMDRGIEIIVSHHVNAIPEACALLNLKIVEASE